MNITDFILLILLDSALTLILSIGIVLIRKDINDLKELIDKNYGRT